MKSRRKFRFLILLLCALVMVAGILVYAYCFFVPKKYASLVVRYSEEYGLEEELVFAVIRSESNFDKNAVSRAGAVGLMQIMPSTALFIWKSMGETDTPNLTLPENNIAAGTWYLKYLSEKFSDLDTLLAAYNAGEGIVRKWLNESEYSTDKSSLENIPYRETREYVGRVKKFYNYYKILYF